MTCPPGFDALVLGGCTMTWVAVMVVLSVAPSTRTGSPVVTALTVAALVPFSSVVEDASLMVTFWPVAVVSVNPEEDTLLTVPTVPRGRPGAGVGSAAGSGTAGRAAGGGDDPVGTAITMAATPAAMTLLRLLETLSNSCPLGY